MPISKEKWQLFQKSFKKKLGDEEEISPEPQPSPESPPVDEEETAEKFKKLRSFLGK